MILSTSNGIVSSLKLSCIYMVLEFLPKSCVVSSRRIASVGLLGFPISRIQRNISTGVADLPKCLHRRDCGIHLTELTWFLFWDVSTVSTVMVCSHGVTHLSTAFTLRFAFCVTCTFLLRRIVDIRSIQLFCLLVLKRSFQNFSLILRARTAVLRRFTAGKLDQFFFQIFSLSSLTGCVLRTVLSYSRFNSGNKVL
jgi:hypothetical protein